ncbi:LegC family aminotransferase [Verminephrobacter aporrectodeae subsp. tuberculatae]|uniref:LegC family aminotransferase n=1 Tax=Verminephrobacter aporrectodeae subsp. tuberculatae TaxID=1110392 RepID=A0ABT3KNX3_9BURK|nr:LegC family aminotransferase [Verminephrobacter aporrectodeae]MCW5221412.1 LegC family aminotransferase [Verminephrobacter aporrectodeae subsp. tuberculatae]MCW5257722.1 LegC family aminotransferase [Verminephrobacter aporrectodeae subsp. tuberculatae]MCW5290703.1 LegC family aminotransferase [Verminephrobacter aporrectodeae subsp. tuberculatae]MCW5320008.1 LegC family aminotransferase [Verminephrobacter aporrectodeae subsp. tuberculatae]MCW8164704.1 LegC family aminotransferase [Verminephr
MTHSATSSEIIAAITAVLGNAPRPVALHEPLFVGHENAYVTSCIDAGWVSSVGSFVNRFENDLAAFCGAQHAVVMVNGTCAMHAALMVSGVQAGDEVLVPALTFVATANAVVHAGAVPHFVDVEESALGVDPVALRSHLEGVALRQSGHTVNRLTGRRIRALMPVHVFGHPCRLEELAAIAQEWGLQLIEDATEALGSTVDGRPVGGRHTAVFSFNGNKIITTGGGGGVTTNDEDLYLRLKHLTTAAKQPHAWAFLHDEVGYNYRMPNLNAALGCAQLEQAPRFLAAKRALAAAYARAFTGLSGLRILPSPPGTESNYWLVTLLAENADPGWLDTTLQALHGAGLQCRPVWQPLHLLPMYHHHPRSPLPRTESLAQRIISLPSSVRLGLPLLPA